jgi:hypothetical protein
MLSTPTTTQVNGHGQVTQNRLKSTKNADVMEPMVSPGTKIDGFDWEDLECRYRNAMEERGVQEQILHQEFEQLMQVFEMSPH